VTGVVGASLVAGAPPQATRIKEIARTTITAIREVNFFMVFRALYFD
jgi:hypothetical protein